MIGFILLLVAWAFLNADVANSESTAKEVEQPYVIEHYVLYNSEIYSPCSCISYAKWALGYSQSYHMGNANEIVPNSINPAPSGIVLLKEGVYGHVAYYERLGAVLKLKEANYIPCKYSERVVLVTDPNIRGYLN